ncbi:MAG TPA: molybdopterin-dependent oxidoreductase [Defluviitoga tunisiensis]|jgi:hypothetical protein|nr:molybdopterin-dependent oxidoreductase [Defluviitoga tunisiensis]HOP25228.1 molybdopterin-dependent oxidoreductase [Defluviitoga sp.]HOL86728.1 molybdopterin-dependent oxidoreductase [Defluviitoga tunisiensis]HPP10492.1 molybdopterin-dependent oxidoreductase [Defluviitoga tunisiensis]HPZ66978.1 molybdopterin-dependent oxidoreductase [Defluviitoga tunisiensis]
MKKAFLCLITLIFVTGIIMAETTTLTVSGVIALRDEKGEHVFTMEELESFEQVTYFVTDPYLGDKTYRGVAISDLLKYVGVPANTKNVVIVASDGMEVSVEYADVMEYPIILAYATVSGEKVRAIPSSQGGPIKLVFPLQEHPELFEKYPNWCWWVVGVRVEI